MFFKNILVPFDGSNISKKAFEKALAIASQFETKLSVITIISSPFVVLSGISLYRAKEIQNKEEREIIQTLNVLYNRAKNKEVKFSYKVVHNSSTTSGIMTFVKANNIDLIVIGSHGRTGINKIILGSVAYSVVQHAKCTVMIVK